MVPTMPTSWGVEEGRGEEDRRREGRGGEKEDEAGEELRLA